jgi:hypothetical protein
MLLVIVFAVLLGRVRLLDLLLCSRCHASFLEVTAVFVIQLVAAACNTM